MVNAGKKPTFYDEGGKGRKQCPHCKKYVPAVSPKCTNPDCGKDILAKPKGKSSNKSKGRPSKEHNQEGLEQYIETVKGMGGLAQLETAIAEYEKIAKPINDLGGLDNAKAVLATLEEIKKM